MVLSVSFVFNHISYPLFIPQSNNCVIRIHEMSSKDDTKILTCLLQDAPVCTAKVKEHEHEHGSRSKVGTQKRGQGLYIPAQIIVDANSRHEQRCNPIWFSLTACSNQKGDAPLPQISSRYLRVKDATLPVSHIQKYIVNKLDLAREAEVEILLQGQPLVPTLQLHNLVEMWLQRVPASHSHRIHTLVGNSAQDFMMLLSYARKPY